MLNKAPADSELNFPYVLYLIYNTATTAVASNEHELMKKYPAVVSGPVRLERLANANTVEVPHEHERMNRARGRQ